nr:hypothetical protein Iba_chr14bCG15180 [Ipomoea batatas]
MDSRRWFSGSSTHKVFSLVHRNAHVIRRAGDSKLRLLENAITTKDACDIRAGRENGLQNPLLSSRHEHVCFLRIQKEVAFLQVEVQLCDNCLVSLHPLFDEIGQSIELKCYPDLEVEILFASCRNHVGVQIFVQYLHSQKEDFLVDQFTALVSDCPQLRISGITFVSLRSSTVRVRRNRSVVDRRSSASLRLYESANCDSAKKPTANRLGRAATGGLFSGNTLEDSLGKKHLRLRDEIFLGISLDHLQILARAPERSHVGCRQVNLDAVAELSSGLESLAAGRKIKERDVTLQLLLPHTLVLNALFFYLSGIWFLDSSTTGFVTCSVINS